MKEDRAKSARGTQSSEATARGGSAPGKRTLTMGLPVQLAAGRADEAASPAAPSGGGRPLPEDVRGRMERAFGFNFASVQVHEGPHVAAIGARAYTQGSNVHFAPGQYQPHSQQGQELLGHELTHVVQQSQGQVHATTQAKGVRGWIMAHFFEGG